MCKKILQVLVCLLHETVSLMKNLSCLRNILWGPESGASNRFLSLSVELDNSLGARSVFESNVIII